MTLTRSCAIAWAVFLASTIASISCYRHIAASQRDLRHVFDELPRGESFYRIGGEENCVGLLTLKTSEQSGEISVKGGGVLRTSFAGQRGALTIELQADFNALNQLGGAFLRVSGQEGAVIFSLLNVHPILASIKIRTNSLQKDLSTSLPGPITISSSPNGYAISAKSGQKIPEHLGSVLQQPIFKGIAVSRSHSGEERMKCEDRGGDVWALDALIDLFKSFGASTQIAGIVS